MISGVVLPCAQSISARPKTSVPFCIDSVAAPDSDLDEHGVAHWMRSRSHISCTGLPGLLDRELGRRVGLEALVGDRGPAPDRNAKGTGANTFFGTIDRCQVPVQLDE